MLCNPADRPTALIAINNNVAMGIMKYAEEVKLRIPEDLVLIQLNDISVSKLLKIPLTSVYQNDFERGRIAVQLITGNNEGRKVLVNPQLNIRTSA